MNKAFKKTAAFLVSVAMVLSSVPCSFAKAVDNGNSATYSVQKNASSKTTARAATNEAASLPSGYTSTDSLAELYKYDAEQKNGSIAIGNDGDSFLKTAEWTDKQNGKAKISLRYQVPENTGPSVAVYIFGECSAHGFSADIAQRQILELLQSYDRVDCITTHHPGKWYVAVGMSVEQYIGASYMVSESFLANDASNNNKIYAFLHQYSDQFSGGLHATGALALRYLQEYLKTTTPAAIYISLDNNLAFQNDTYGPEREYATQLLSGMSYANLNAYGSYSLFDIDMDTMAKIAEYQKEGRYYVCRTAKFGDIVSEHVPFGLDIVGYKKNEMGSIFLAYYSVATFAPYYFVYHNQELRDYFASGTTNYKKYSDFCKEIPGAQPYIDYSQSYGSQGTSFVRNTATITDTICSEFSFSKNDIKVTVLDENESPISPQPDISISVSGQTVTIEGQNIDPQNIVLCEISCEAVSDSLMSADGGWLNTNDGKATAKISNGDTLSVDSPKLYKHTAPDIPAPTKTVSGEKAVSTDGTHNAITHLDSYQYDVYQVIPREDKIDYFKSFAFYDKFPVGVRVDSWQVLANGIDVTNKWKITKTTANEADDNNRQDTITATYIGNLSDASAYGVTYDFRFQVTQTEDYAYTKAYYNYAATSIVYNNVGNHYISDGKGDIKKDSSGNPICETENLYAKNGNETANPSFATNTTTDTSKATHYRTTNEVQTDVAPLGSITLKKVLPDGLNYSASMSAAEKAVYKKGFAFVLTNTATGKEYYRTILVDADHLDASEAVIDMLPIGTYTLAERGSIGYALTNITGTDGSTTYNAGTKIATITVAEGKKDIVVAATNAVTELTSGVAPGEGAINHIAPAA